MDYVTLLNLARARDWIVTLSLRTQKSTGHGVLFKLQLFENRKELIEHVPLATAMLWRPKRSLDAAAALIERQLRQEQLI